MHLKNFALLTNDKKGISLSPAYDMLCTKIALPEDTEETALSINGKKRKIIRKDFDSLAKNLKITEKAMQNAYSGMTGKIKEAKEWINISFLPDKLKEEYIHLLETNAEKLGLF